MLGVMASVISGIAERAGSRKAEPAAEPQAKPAMSFAEASAVAERDCEARGRVVYQVSIDRETGEPTFECGIGWRVAKRDDTDGPTVQRAHHLVTPPTATREELTQLLNLYYSILKRDVAAQDGSRARKVFVWIYPNETRALAGWGEWIAMGSAIATDGNELPQSVEPSFKLPAAGATPPTAQQDRLYDRFKAALKGAHDPEKGEAAAVRSVSRDFGVRADEGEKLIDYVSLFRQGVDPGPSSELALRSLPKQ